MLVDLIVAPERLREIYDIVPIQSRQRKHWGASIIIYPCPPHHQMINNWQGLLEEAGSAEELSQDLAHGYYAHCTFSSEVIHPNEASNGHTRRRLRKIIPWVTKYKLLRLRYRLKRKQLQTSTPL
jgi:hypothetical protein